MGSGETCNEGGMSITSGGTTNVEHSVRVGEADNGEEVLRDEEGTDTNERMQGKTG